MKWRNVPSSDSIKLLIQQQLDLILPSIHGYSLVALGELATVFNFQLANVVNVIHITDRQRADVCAHPHQLPLASDDIDAIFVPLLLEESNRPHEMLREVARSLRPGGKIILVTFNPISVWGFHKLIFHRSKRQPWCYPFYRKGRLVDWLTLLGLDITLEHGLFAKLPGSEYHPSSDHIESVAYSRFGAINFLVAEKKIKTLTSIRASWKEARLINSGVIEPTRKNIDNI